MQQHLHHSSRAERAAGTVAAIQLRRLQARTRTEEGGAAKERRRVQPGLPWRLRARGAKRARPMAAEGQAPVAAVQPLVAGDLLQMKPGRWPSPTAVRSAVQDAGPPVAGLHHLVVQGPWPVPGSCKAVNGRMAGQWSCTGCGRRAGDSSRAGALARTPCGAAVWAAQAAVHELHELDGVFRCSRCGLHTTAQHAGQASRARCPVPSLQRDGHAWPEGEASLQSLLGQICGYRRWCEAPVVAEVEAEATAHQQPLCTASSEEPTVASSHCGRNRTLPVDVAGGCALTGLQRPLGGLKCLLGGLKVPAAEPAAKKPRLEDGAGRLWVAAAVGPAPLAAAAGPVERRQLKRAAHRPAEGAAEPLAASQAAAAARAECSSISVAALVATWSRGGSSSFGDAVLPACVPVPVVLVPVQPVQLVPINAVQLEPRPELAAPPPSRAKRARMACAVQSGPPALSWQPYSCHKALRLGRSGLWCLSCFSQPVGDYRVWLRERCSDERPPSAAPSRLSAALLRTGDLEAGASEALRIRHAVLLAAARVVPVPAAAFRFGDQAGGRQVQSVDGTG